MAGKRILIASQHPLFDEGINSMLVSEPGVEVVGVCRGDVDAIEKQAIDLRTDVILIFGQPNEMRMNTARLLDRAVRCLVKVETGGNTVQIYRRQELLECELDDVVTAVLADC